MVCICWFTLACYWPVTTILHCFVNIYTCLGMPCMATTMHYSSRIMHHIIGAKLPQISSSDKGCSCSSVNMNPIGYLMDMVDKFIHMQDPALTNIGRCRQLSRWYGSTSLQTSSDPLSNHCHIEFFFVFFVHYLYSYSSLLCLHYTLLCWESRDI